MTGKNLNFLDITGLIYLNSQQLWMHMTKSANILSCMSKVLSGLNYRYSSIACKGRINFHLIYTYWYPYAYGYKWLYSAIYFFFFVPLSLYLSPSLSLFLSFLYLCSGWNKHCPIDSGIQILGLQLGSLRRNTFNEEVCHWWQNLIS